MLTKYYHPIEKLTILHVKLLTRKNNRTLMTNFNNVSISHELEAIKYAEDGRGYKVYIEFEYLSSDFVRHGHLERMKKGKPCDLIVCWEHDSMEIPKEIQVLELKTIIRNLPKEAI
jgi:hypothetical protein